jgi:hypothetical protein
LQRDISGGRTVSQDLVPIVIRIPADLHNAIKETAAAEERSMAQTMRRALRSYTDNATTARKRRR